MSIEYRAILCYGIELTREKELAYIERVGEKRWEEIFEDFFIVTNDYEATHSGILGIAIACACEGESDPLGKLPSLVETLVDTIHSSGYDDYRAAMVELQEFETQPQTFLVCQVS